MSIATFNLSQFQDHLGNVDKDYRLMALFDLMKSLKNEDVISTSDAVVSAVIKALADTDGQVRNDAVSVFPLLIVSCRTEQQNAIFAQLLKSAAAQASWFGSKEFSEHADLCAMALKRSTTAIADASQRNIGKWQSEVPVVMTLLKQTVEELQKPLTESGRENVYGAILGLISPFAGTWAASVTQSLAQCAMKDFRAFPNSCRLTSTCLAKLLPFTDANTFTAVRNFSLDGLETGDEKTFPAFLQLCGEEFASDSYRLRSSAPRLVDALLARLKTVADGTEDPKADNELLTMDTLLNTYRMHLCSKWSEVFDVCRQISTLGITADAAAEGDGYAADEYYEDDYYGAGTDETWKLRREALRVTASLATLSAEESFGAKALSVAGQAICDTFEEVQLEAFPVIQSVARKPYATSPQIVNSLVDLCPTLLYFLQFQGKTFIPALGCIELFFRPDNDASSFAPHVAKNFEEVLNNTPKSPPHRVDLVRVTCRVLESILASPSPSVHKYATQLCLALVETTTADSHPKAVQQCIGAAELFIAAHRLSPTAQIGEKTLAMYDSICTAKESDLAVRSSVVAAAGRWCAACEAPQLVARALTVLEQGILDESTSAIALRTLADSIVSEVCSQEIQSAAVLENVVAALGASQPTTRQAACDCVTALLRAGVKLNQKLADTVLGESERRITDCFCATLYMCGAFCDQNPNSASRIYEKVLSQSWDKVSLHPHEEYTFMPSPSVVAFACACAAVSKASVTLRQTISERVLQYIEKSSSGDALSSCALVRGVAVADDEFTAAFVADMQRKLTQHRSNWLLALGEAGGAMTLNSAYIAELVSSVDDQSSERTRACGKTALSLAMPNPRNSALLTECTKRAIAVDTKGPVYLVKAIQGAARRAAGMTASCFQDAKLCLPLMETLLLHQSDDDMADAVGGCLGSMACFFPDEAFRLFCTTAEKNRPSATDKNKNIVHMVCASAARFILTSTDNAKAQLSAKPLTELLFPGFTRDYDVPLRQSLARLFTAVAHTFPEWLRCEDFKSAFAGLVVDLIPCSKLVGSLKIGNYTHCTDRGLELRVQAFECMSAIFDADERKGAGVLTLVSVTTDLLNALIQECGSNGAAGSTGTAETDKSISDRAKRLVIRFLRLFPDTELTDEQINQLCNNLDVNLDVAVSKGADVETRDASTVQSISLICNLEKCPCFAHNATFQKLLTKAVQSPFLADAVALK